MTNGTLGTFDPTTLLNGIVKIRLRATDTSGGSAVTEPVSVVLTKNQKIGNFTVSFLDMTVPMPGFPIQIVRTYDSRNRGNPGDFGYGWTLDIKTIRVYENLVLGNLWNMTVSGSIIKNYCIVPAKPHVVSVVLPDGTSLRFQPTLSPNGGCQQIAPLTQVAIGFVPLPGTVASLAMVGDNLAVPD